MQRCDYVQSPKKLKQRLEPMTDPNVVHNPICNKHYAQSICAGQPYWISECGGTVWAADRSDGWGYSDTYSIGYGE